jgi:hypothetical protein
LLVGRFLSTSRPFFEVRRLWPRSVWRVLEGQFNAKYCPFPSFTFDSYLPIHVSDKAGYEGKSNTYASRFLASCRGRVGGQNLVVIVEDLFEILEKIL